MKFLLQRISQFSVVWSECGVRKREDEAIQSTGSLKRRVSLVPRALLGIPRNCKVVWGDFSGWSAKGYNEERCAWDLIQKIIHSMKFACCGTHLKWHGGRGRQREECAGGHNKGWAVGCGWVVERNSLVKNGSPSVNRNKKLLFS